jgi:hypothetical protein
MPQVFGRHGTEYNEGWVNLSRELDSSRSRDSPETRVSGCEVVEVTSHGAGGNAGV